MADTNNSASVQTDVEIIARVLNGEPQVFDLLLDRYQFAVARTVRGKVPLDETEEVTHEVFIRVFESLANYRPIKPFKNWLTTIAIRTCYDFWRQHYRNKEISVTSLSPEQQNWLRGHTPGKGGETKLKMILKGLKPGKYWIGPWDIFQPRTEWF